MKFELDKQTLEDLEIFRSGTDGRSISGLFNHTIFLGGNKKLYDFLKNPLTDLSKINERKEVVLFFKKHFPQGLKLDKDSLDFSQFYLKDHNTPSMYPSRMYALEQRIMDLISTGADYYLVKKGVSSSVEVFKNVYSLAQEMEKLFETEECPVILKRKNEKIFQIFEQAEYQGILDIKKMGAYQTARYDYIFRTLRKKDLAFMHDLIYEYDAYCAITKAMEINNLNYPEMVDASQTCLEVEGLSHPLLKNAIANDLTLDKSGNLIFISGPNMAGKSTFLKALGIACYLAHTGLPVPATKMKMSLLSGICTTINISDDLSAGYSHFYAEVMRVKDVASKLKTHKNMLVIFDELFRGTNVKDAYDGTLAVTTAFAKIENSFFVVSSHIVEAAEAMDGVKNMKFGYFDIDQSTGAPAYIYKLRDGISDVRLGMYIINKEGLIDLIESSAIE